MSLLEIKVLLEYLQIARPLLNKLAAKPDMSPVIPPPNEIKQSVLEKFFLSKILRIRLVVL